METRKKNLRTAAMGILLLLLVSLAGNIVFESKSADLKNERDAAKLNAEKSLSEKLQVEKSFANSQADLEKVNMKKADEEGIIAKQGSYLSEDVAKIKKLLKDNLRIPALKKELAKLKDEFPENIINYHFDVQVSNDELYFDYKLKPGVCNSLNASILMKKIGIEL